MNTFSTNGFLNEKEYLLFSIYVYNKGIVLCVLKGRAREYYFEDPDRYHYELRIPMNHRSGTGYKSLWKMQLEATLKYLCFLDFEKSFPLCNTFQTNIYLKSLYLICEHKRL